MRTPTGIFQVDLSISMLSSNALGSDLIELVGRLLSESARFNIWFGSVAKVAATPRQLAMLSLTMNQQLRNIYNAWMAFIDAYSAGGRKVGTFERQEDALREVLSSAVSTLSSTRRDFRGSGE
jgi:hypothetical protein